MAKYVDKELAQRKKKHSVIQSNFYHHIHTYDIILPMTTTVPTSPALVISYSEIARWPSL